MEIDTQTNTKSNPGRIIILGVLSLTLLTLVFAAGVITGLGLDAFRVPGSSSPAFPVEIPANGVGEQDKDAGEANMTVFWEVWNTVHDRYYYDLPSDQELIYGAINGMLDTLDDPYTAFVTPDVARILREDNTGSFEGIGAYVEEAPDGGVYIIRVFEGSPAEEAGVLAGDVVVAVDGEDITGNILNESLLLIRGPAGSDVNLTIVREGETEVLNIIVTRGTIEIPTVESRMLEDNIGYVALYDFNSSAGSRLEDAVKELLDQGAESIILDLRNNPGGFLTQAIRVSDLFLPRGVVLIERDVDGNVEEHTSTNGDIAEDIPLVVLINENSASASEIVAGAIQDRERGTLIGQTSFGKGSVQLLFDLSDESQLRVTFANWFTPNDNTINGVGITPDIEVELPDEPGTTDLVLERAIEFLKNGQ